MMAWTVDTIVKKSTPPPDKPYVPPITEGMTRKGGRNQEPSQIKQRPAKPGKVQAMSDSDMKAELELLRKENAALKADAPVIRMKVSEKGALSIYGINARFPVTLYKAQWLTILNMADEIRAFIKANDKLLKNKGDD